MALTDNLVSYWKLDESSGNAADSVGSNTLTNNGTITYSASKINNGANLVAASSQYFSKTSQTGLAFSGGSFSLAFWTNPTSLVAFTYLLTLFDDDAPDSRSWYTRFNATGGVSVTLRAADNLSNLTATVAAGFTTGSLQHCVITYTASTHLIEVYRNGTSQGTADITATSFRTSGSTFEIGSLISGGQNPAYTGQLDEIGAWSRVLTSTEVSQLYNSGNGLQYPFAGATTANPHLLSSTGVGA